MSSVQSNVLHTDPPVPICHTIAAPPSCTATPNIHTHTHVIITNTFNLLMYKCLHSPASDSLSKHHVLLYDVTARSQLHSTDQLQLYNTVRSSNSFLLLHPVILLLPSTPLSAWLPNLLTVSESILRHSLGTVTNGAFVIIGELLYS